MCISRCHIIFWGDKTLTNLGITSWNVILWNVNVTSHQVRRHDLLCDGLRQSIEMMCIITKNVGLLPWVVCVSGISSYFDDGSSTLHRSVSVELWNALVKHSDVELWTAEMSFQYNVRLMNDLHLWIFCYWMNSFVKSFLLFTEWDVIASTITDATFFVIRPSSSSFATWSTNIHHLFTRTNIHRLFTRFGKDFHIKSAAGTLDRDWQLSQLRETV